MTTKNPNLSNEGKIPSDTDTTLADSGEPSHKRELPHANDLARFVSNVLPKTRLGWLILAQAETPLEPNQYIDEQVCKVNPLKRGRVQAIKAQGLQTDKRTNIEAPSPSQPTKAERKNREFELIYPHSSKTSLTEGVRLIIRRVKLISTKPLPDTWGGPLAYLLALILAEIVVTYGNLLFGLCLHAVIMFTLFRQGSVSLRLRERRFRYVMALVPLIRLLSFLLPTSDYPLLGWYMYTGVALFIASFMAMKIAGLPWRRLGIYRGFRPSSGLIALTGILVGWIEYLILKPDPYVDSLRLDALLLPSIVLLVFTGFLEELIFRGLIQQTALELLGPSGLIYVPLTYTLLYIGQGSITHIFFVWATSTLFSLMVRKTGSIVGVSLAHGLANICLFLIYPQLPLIVP